MCGTSLDHLCSMSQEDQHRIVDGLDAARAPANNQCEHCSTCISPLEPDVARAPQLIQDHELHSGHVLSVRNRYLTPPDRLWSGAFSGVSGQSEALVCRISIKIAELLCRTTAFIATNPNSDHMPIFVLDGQLKNPLRRLDPKVTNRVEDPQN